MGINFIFQNLKKTKLVTILGDEAMCEWYYTFVIQIWACSSQIKQFHLDFPFIRDFGQFHPW